MASSTLLARRWRRYVLSPIHLFGILRGRITLKTHFPDDAKPLGVSYEPAVNSITLYIESQEFPAIAFGDEIPIEALKFSRHTRN